MISNPWQVAGASVIGTSHVRHGQPCQDSHGFRVLKSSTAEVLLCAVSDGAGSASRSHEGAALACDLFLQMAEERVSAAATVAVLDRGFFLEWLAQFRSSVRELARADNAEPHDYACTFLGAALDRHCAAFAQLGDGAIVVSDDDADSFSWVFWPQTGEYANVTNFATSQDAAVAIEHAFVPRAIAELALFTDGVQSLALQMQSRSAHQPFFRAVFKPMRAANADREKLDAGLGAFLGSAAVNERTDDDKTIILASRAAALPVDQNDGRAPAD
jgi:hypothetical protein